VSRPLRLLVVEDNPGDVRLVRLLLSDSPTFKVVTQVAVCLAEALQHVSAQEFDVVLLDLGLPDASGLTALTAVRAAAPSLPVVVLTGRGDEETGLEAVREGAQEYCVKGQVDGRQLASALRYAVERMRADEALRASERRYRELFDDSLALICEHTLDGALIEVNPAAALTLGYPLEAARRAAGRNLREFLPREIHDEFDRYLKRIADAGRDEGILRVLGRDGQERLWKYRNVLRKGSAGASSYVIGFALDVTREVHARKALAATEERYRSLFESNPAPVLVYDVDTLDLLAANAAATAFYGYGRDELLAMGLPALHAAEDLPALAALRERPQEGEPTLWRHKKKDGTVVEVETTGHEMAFGGRRACCVVVVDVTERRRVERFKDQLIGLAAHELRSPLASIHTALSLMFAESEALSARHLPLVDIAVKNAERMAGLINNLLDLEMAESGELSFHDEPVELSSLLEGAIELNRAYAQQFDVGLTLDEVPPGVHLVADRERLLQVLTNLLGNAVKFSPAGESVVVSASLEGDHVRFRIVDRGPGIPDELQGHLFQRFAHGRHRRPRKGSGLGLAICRAIVERLGGTIGFTTRAGAGTTFYFDLPTGDRAST
jgi:PAS domain S-box-containing protein